MIYDIKARGSAIAMMVQKALTSFERDWLL